MAFVVKDRVQVTSTSTGTGTFTLGSAVFGYQDFTAIGSGNTTHYCIVHGNDWEVGIGTFTTGSLSRDTVLESTNAGAKVNFGAGDKLVFVTYPAEKSVHLDEVQTLTNKTINGADNTLTIVTDNIANDAITSDKIANNAVGTSEIANDAVTADKIATGAVGSSELASTSVTAGTYGNATNIPQFTVDQDGRLTSASNVALTTGGMTLLGTLTTTSGSTQTLSGLNLSGYQQLYVRFDSSLASGNTIRINGVDATDNLGTSSLNLKGFGWIDLSNSSYIGYAKDANGSASIKFIVNTGITNASNSVTFTTGSTFDAGFIQVYGVK